MSIRSIFTTVAALVTAALIAIVFGLSLVDRSEAQSVCAGGAGGWLCQTGRSTIRH